MDKLLPCPFCGENNAESKIYLWGKHRETKDTIWLRYVFCSDCNAMTDNMFKTEVEAITAWNTRVKE